MIKANLHMGIIKIGVGGVHASSIYIFTIGPDDRIGLLMLIDFRTNLRIEVKES